MAAAFAMRVASDCLISARLAIGLLHLNARLIKHDGGSHKHLRVHRGLPIAIDNLCHARIDQQLGAVTARRMRHIDGRP